MLKAQLFGRVHHLAHTVPQAVLVSKDGSQAIVDSAFKRDGLSVVNNIYKHFNGLITTKRGSNEHFSNNEARSDAKLSKFNSYAFSLCLCEALSAFLLLSNAQVDNAQKVFSILAACNGGSNVKKEQAPVAAGPSSGGT